MPICNGNAGGHPGRKVYRLTPMCLVRDGDEFYLEATDPGDHLHGKPPLQCIAVGDAHRLGGGDDDDAPWGVNVFTGTKDSA